MSHLWLLVQGYFQFPFSIQLPVRGQESNIRKLNCEDSIFNAVQKEMCVCILGINCKSICLSQGNLLSLVYI